MDEIKNCQCGNAAVTVMECGCITNGENCGDKHGDILKHVQCSVCSLRAYTIKDWNTRPVEDELLEALEKIANIEGRAFNAYDTEIAQNAISKARGNDE